VFARNNQRSGFAWILRQFGASEALLDRLVDQDLGDVFGDLQTQAARGESSAINILGWMSIQRCAGRGEEMIDSYLQHQLAESRELPANDRLWFGTLVRLQADYDKKAAAACARVDRMQIATWVNRRAASGDPVSQFLRSRDNGPEIGRSRNMIVSLAPGHAVSELWLRKAADAGLAQAKFELALDILNVRQPRVTPASYSAMTLLREAADSVPRAEATRAACEYSGCEGTTPDAAAALTHARDAAIRGETEMFLEIGPQLARAQADEVAAWKLIHASLEQQGCGRSSVRVAWMKGLTEDISAASAVPGALELATKLWEDHGRQMMSGLGCAT